MDGTESYRWSVPSCPHDSPTGPYSPSLPLNSKTIEQLAFSSAGYCVVAPDYAGLGFDTNSLVTPYLVADREPLAVIDALRAARQLAAQINVTLNGRLFLTGYSQGGHVCLATHRLLEQDYAAGDNTVSPTNSIIAHAAMQALGADVSLVNVGATLNHGTGFGPSEIGMLRHCNRYRYTVSPAEPADFDGDRKADPALWQASTATLFVKLSASGYAVAMVTF
ncbi:MAG: alpha/beta fold hydrolase [Verrucomicrobia bacterium]|nr:alpha/beta fold hydrolase [Verrucomicrobiota bacterium]MCG2679415.1 alpha/beta fold hydrolase [Kiritimatiellia bacterium]MBU4247599.1 alpha/beta fold hydrolase [Verrucomicrobiota bacterium]MBU4289856.1 alpha/beta fold hydrolase [Verrucomicrobiota bacterium]MBU4428776.1 alpha/beta fold hydrolase [Verrucomicrobiota bacterium]